MITNVVQTWFSFSDSSPDFSWKGNRTGMAATDSEFVEVAKVTQAVSMETALDTSRLW